MRNKNENKRRSNKTARVIAARGTINGMFDLNCFALGSLVAAPRVRPRRSEVGCDMAGVARSCRDVATDAGGTRAVAARGVHTGLRRTGRAVISADSGAARTVDKLYDNIALHTY